jgi:eukaryotic-like serine/threonine-protein kinase
LTRLHHVLSSAGVVERAAGARFGRYEVLRRLGVGGAAEVFEARHVELNKRVALKVAHPMPAADERSIERSLREGRAATAIDHPNIVDVIDVGVEDCTPYLVMELLEGESLAESLKRTSPLSVEETAELLMPVVSGICAVHRSGIIHRDLKPSNILLAQRYREIQPVVVDFGISVSRTEPPTSFHGLVGTVPYMSPEQIRGLPEATPEWDQYALGVILYECVTGGTPFWGDDRYELLHAIVTGSLVPPSHVNPNVPSAFDAVVLRALTRDPKARFASVEALGKALWPFAGDAPRAKWSAEFGPIGAGESRDPEEASASLVAYSRAAWKAGGSAATRRAGLFAGAFGAAAVLSVAALGSRAVIAKGASNTPAGVPSSAPLTVAPELSARATTETEPERGPAAGKLEESAGPPPRGLGKATAASRPSVPRTASPSPAPPPRATPPAGQALATHLPSSPNADAIEAPPEAIDPLDIR